MGVSDKRLLIIESEFGKVLKVSKKDGNTLSQTVRQAWDSGKLETLTKNESEIATNPHIAIIGHITFNEFNKEITETDVANGLLNRFLYCLSERSKLLPHGGNLHKVDISEISLTLGKVLSFLDSMDSIQMVMSEEASKLWEVIYKELTTKSYGNDKIDNLNARTEPHTLRIAAIYALLDCKKVIEVPHLKAAYALVKYSEDSLNYLYSSKEGAQIPTKIEQFLKRHPYGVSRKDISHSLFKRNKSSDEITHIKNELLELGKIIIEEKDGKEIWRLL